MSEETFHYQGQVESELGRALTAEELVAVSSITQLSNVQLAVAKELAANQRVACIAYLEAIVPSALRSEIMQFANRL
jgi:hypothetical protein